MRVVQIAISLLHFLVAAACAYGFLASFEPHDDAIKWRFGYGAVFAAAIAGGAWWLRRALGPPGNRH